METNSIYGSVDEYGIAEVSGFSPCDWVAEQQCQDEEIHLLCESPDRCQRLFTDDTCTVSTTQCLLIAASESFVD